MTHDELLAKIDELERFSEWTHYLGDNRYAQSIPHTQKVMLDALRAVVELHKPFTEFVDDASCEACFNSEYSNKDQPYPCDTIQAIEAALK